MVHERARLTLKQPTGWFAAGREVAQALAVLLRWGFQTVLSICACRRTGILLKRESNWPGWLECCEKPGVDRSRSRRTGPLWGMSTREMGSEIRDRFWPYHKQAGASPASPKPISSGRRGRLF